MSRTDPQNEPSRIPEWLQVVIAIGMYLVIFGSCSSASFLLERQFGVWFGLLGAIGAIICWIYLVPPMPGFVQGIIALSGLFVLIAILIVRMVKVVQFVAAG